MMVINVQFANKEVEVSWHVGAPIPIAFEDRAYVTEVQADGDELELIKRSIDRIPYLLTGKRLVRWFGDDAKFIVANL